jgi:hypothetical protein
MGRKNETYEYIFKIALRRTFINKGIYVKSTLTIKNIPFILPINAPNEYVARVIEQYCAEHYKEWNISEFSTTFLR